MVDKPNVNLEFFTTSILGLIGAIDWLAPPVFAVIDKVLTGFDLMSASVPASWKRLSLILLTK